MFKNRIIMENRRSFIKKMGIVGGAAVAFPYISNSLNAQERQKFDETPVRLGFVGTGLMGGDNMKSFKSLKQKLVAYCDVDAGDYGFGNAKKYADPDAASFVDYREMFDKMKGKMDAVVISTPDHNHFAVAMCAIKHGYDIYLEKPLCYSIWQCRELAKAAKAAGVKTQMGNFVHSGDGIRTAKEWIDAGLIGTVKEVIMWTCRPLVGVNERPGSYKSWPKPDPIPPNFDWDKWQNIATPTTTFTKRVVPLNWRRFWKFGTGSLGDIGCHMLDVPIECLGLGSPSRVESRQRGGTEISVPLQDNVNYYFDTSASGKPVTLRWFSGFVQPKNGKYEKDYDKSFLPPLPDEYLKTGRGYEQLPYDGQFIVGTEGVLFSPKMHLIGAPVILPKSKAADAKAIAKKLPRVRHNDHRLNFLDAVRGNVESSCSNFDVAAVLTESVLLGNMSLRTNSKIVWDAEKLACADNPAANALVKPAMREGWF